MGFTVLAWAVALAADGRIEVDTWTSRDGLPQNSVTDLLQDDHGFLWVTTFGGIARFDGLRFKVFDPANSPGLPAARFLSVAQTPDGTLWFGSEGGGLVRRAEQGFEVVGPPRGEIWDLELAGDRLFAASLEGVFEVRGDELVQVDERPAFDLLARRDGTLWAAGPNGLLEVGKPGQVGDKGARALAEDEHGRLSAVVGRDVGVVENGRFVPVREVEGWSMPAPVAWAGATWWAAEGALLRDGHPTVALETEVRTLLVDREDGLWIGTNGAGLLRARRTGVTLLSEDSRTFARRPDGSLVVWACERSVALSGAPLPPAFDAFCGHGLWDGEDLWLDGTLEGESGVHRWAKDGRTLALGGDVELLDGGWVLAGRQIHRVQHGRLEAFQLLEGTGPLHPVRGGEALWVVDDQRTLLEVGATTTSYGQVPGVAVVRDVLPSSDGVWVATYGGGLVWLGNDGGVRRLTQADGLCDDAVSRLLPMEDGSVWMNTNRGAGRVPAARLDAFRVGDAHTVTCELVESGEANGPGGKVIEGELFLPTIHGAVRVDPATALQPPVPPKVVVERATLGGRAVRSASLHQGVDDLDVDLTGLAFDDPHGVRFRHRLIGLDDVWSRWSPVRRIRYLDLPPGPYRLEVQARSSRGVPSEVVALPFRRKPAFNETVVARVLLPLGFVSAVFLLLVFRVRSTMAQNAELRREVEQRLHAERMLLQQQEAQEQAVVELEAARRMEAVGRLAGGVAHDFNNLLTVILGRMEPYLESPDDVLREDAGIIVTTAQRAADLTSQLLTFGKRSVPREESIDVSEALNEMRPLLTKLVDGVRLRLGVEEGLVLRIARTRLEQLVTNLVVNARDAMEPGGTLRVFLVAESSGWAVLRVEDDGRGMTSDVLERVFEPYFTTKGEGRGTGLGMATVHGVVEEVGGHIVVASTVGVGTTVTVRLPRAMGQLATPRPSVARTSSLVGIRVFLVDDDDDVRKTVAEQLRALGADVDTSSGPADALERLADDRPDVLVSDVLMPGMSGEEMFAELQARGIELPVVFISGHTGASLGLDDARVLRKPFTARELGTAVVEAYARPEE